MKNPLSKETLEQYRSMLPHGAMGEIAKELGYNRTSIYNFLSGRSYSTKIEMAVLRKISSYKEERDMLLEKLGLR